MNSALAATAPHDDRTHLFAPDNASVRSRCPTKRKVKAVAVEALYCGIAGACVGLASSAFFNLTLSPCTLGMECFGGFLAGATAGTVRKISSYIKYCTDSPLSYSNLLFLAAAAGVTAGVGLGAGLGAATDAMGCDVGPIGGLAAGLIGGALAGLAAPLASICVPDDPSAIDSDNLPPPSEPAANPLAEDL